ncbi:MAG: phosphatidate cytidylyltransferase [Planctomycetes bacterium]|nr:phosphatidate cytidylyltransferase [Planctomycetota bacterium]
MQTRIRIGTLLFAGVLALLGLDHAAGSDAGFTLLVGLLVAGGLYEFYAMMVPGWGRLPSSVGVAGGALLVGLNWLEIHWAGATNVPWTGLLLFLLVFGAFAQHMATSEPSTLPRLFILVFGLIYIWLPMSFALRLRDFQPRPDLGGVGPGEALCFFVLLVCKMTDAGAYFAGKAFGREKLAPVISPGKTVEGAFGGLAAGLVFGLGTWACTSLWLYYSWWAAVVLSLVVSVAGQLGDLSESLVKRYARTKDSGALLPAFGGVLDLLDSFLVGVPATYLCVLALPAHDPTGGAWHAVPLR